MKQIKVAKAHKFAIYLFSSLLTLFSASAVAVEEKYIDVSVKPGTNFFQRANGLWLKSAEKKTAGFSSAYGDAEKALEQKIKECINNSAQRSRNGDYNQLGNMYLSLMNPNNDNKTLVRIISELNYIQKIQDENGLAEEIADLNKMGVAVITNIVVKPDKDGMESIFITLGDKEIKGLTDGEVEGLFNIPGSNISPTGFLTKIVTLNKTLASLKAQTEQGSNEKTAIQTLSQKSSYWSRYLFEHGLYGLHGDKTTHVYINPIYKSQNPLNDATFEEWKKYLQFRFLYEYKDILELARWGFSTSLQIKEINTFSQIEKSFNLDLGRLCFDAYLYSTSEDNPDSINQEVYVMARKIIETYLTRANSASWASNQDTQKTIFNKLDHLRIDIGYEHKVERKIFIKADPEPVYSTFSDVIIDPEDTPLNNAIELKRFEYKYAMSILGDRSQNIKWTDIPYDLTNAYYLPGKNMIIIPLAMLMNPFFTKGDTASNYGSLGTTIGHEVAHIFDKNPVSNSYDWITGEEGRKKFTELTTKFELQYNRKPYSEKTLNEDVADKSGLEIAYRVFKTLPKKSKTLESKEEIPMTDDQKFYYSYAQSHRYIKTLQPDSKYSPDELRVNIPLQNQADFPNTYQFEKGSILSPNKMFLDSNLRINIW